MVFENRTDAGKKLAEVLKKYQGQNTIVYALPRGGVVLGVEIARALNASLDLVVPRKIGHPFDPEYAICAVTESGELICNEAERANIDQNWLAEEVKKEKKESRRRREAYRRGAPRRSPKGKIAIIVDDGVATGLTIRAAIRDIKSRKPAKLMVAVPIIPKDVAEVLRRETDELVALYIPKYYAGAVGNYYREFNQVEDDEVIKLMSEIK